MTVTENKVPVQLPDEGVTIYVAVCAVVVGLSRVPLIEVCAVPDAPPVMPPVTVGALQLYVVPAGTPDGVTVKPTPMHTDTV